MPRSREDTRREAVSALKTVLAASDTDTQLLHLGYAIGALARLSAECRSVRGKYANYPRLRNTILDAGEHAHTLAIEMEATTRTWVDNPLPHSSEGSEGSEDSDTNDSATPCTIDTKQVAQWLIAVQQIQLTPHTARDSIE